MTYKPSSVSSESTNDLRELALIIARAHDLPVDWVVSADEVAATDDEFMTAICISAELKEVCGGY